MIIVIIIVVIAILLLQVGNTALLLTARNGHPSVVEVLIKAGASVDIQDKVETYRI